MLREELKDTDIPHRTKLRERVQEIWEDHLDTVTMEMKVLYSIQMATTFSDLLHVTLVYAGFNGQNLSNNGHVVGP